MAKQPRLWAWLLLTIATGCASSAPNGAAPPTIDVSPSPTTAASTTPPTAAPTTSITPPRATVPACAPGGTFASIVPPGTLRAEDQLEDTGRTEKLRCKRGERDDACIARARKDVETRAPTDKVLGVSVHPFAQAYTVVVEVDGASQTWSEPSLAAADARAKQLAAEGHAVSMTSAHRQGAPGEREALVLVGPPADAPRVYSLVVTASADDLPELLTSVQSRALEQGVDVREFVPLDDGTVRFVVACPRAAPAKSPSPLTSDPTKLPTGCHRPGLSIPKFAQRVEFWH